MELSKETASLINSFSGQIVKLFVDVREEVKFFIDNGLSNYVENQRAKYIETNTFLYRAEKVNFYDIYFPLTLSYKDSQYEIQDDFDSIFNTSKYIAIIGTAGSGKSMLMKHMFLQSLYKSRKIPIVIELRALNWFNGTLIDYIYKEIFNNKLSPTLKILERILGEGSFTFLLDGYDEIYSKNIQNITFEIDSFIDKYNKNNFILTSRPGAKAESILRFRSFNIEPLSTSQIETFINLQLKGKDGALLAKRIIQSINLPDISHFESYLTNPLLLSMFILTYDSYPELPKSKNKFYWNVFDTLCSKHASITKKGGYLHERKTKLQNEDFENILKWFSYKALFDGHFSFDDKYFSDTVKTIKSKFQYQFNINELEDDLTVSIGIILRDGIELKFPHKSLQEYFTALLIKDQSLKNKETIYSKKFLDLETKSLGSNYNLWSLCGELDKICFYKYFVQLVIQNFISSVEDKDEYILLQNFFNFTKHTLFISKKNNENHFEVRSISCDNTVIQSIMCFLDFNFNKLFNNKILENEDLLISVLSKQLIVKSNIQTEINIFNKWSPEIYSFLCELGINSDVKEFLLKVKNKKSELESLIENEENNTETLLDFP